MPLVYRADELSCAVFFCGGYTPPVRFVSCFLVIGRNEEERLAERKVFMKNKRRNGVIILTECSIMIALSAVLSIVKLFELPYGGSITPASMLPIIIIAYRHGAAVGCGSALASSLIQMLLGLNNFSYFTTWQSALTLAALDYVVAFGVFGLAGALKRFIRNQGLCMITGAVACSVLRYICHVISGATVWAGLSIPTEAALVYSLSYNATYMIPETIILTLTAAYLGSALDFSSAIPGRKKSEKLDTVTSFCYIGAGFSALAALVCDTILIFSKLQNYNSGEFFAEGLSEVSWIAVAVVTACCAIVSASLVIFAKLKRKKA